MTPWPSELDEVGAVRRGDVLDHLDEVVFRTDAEGVWTYLNQAWEHLTGFPVAETIGGHFLDVVHPDERDPTVERFMAVVVGGADFCHHEARYRRRDGSYTWVEIRARVVRDEHGSITGNVGTILDIGTRKRDEELVEQETRILERIAADEPLRDVLGAVAGMVARRSGCATTIVRFAPAAPPVTGADASGVVVTAAPDGSVELGLGSGAGPASPDALPIRLHGQHTVGAMVVQVPEEGEGDEPGRAVIARAVDLAALAITHADRVDEVRRRALHDPLTSLPNRSLLDDRLRQAVAEARRLGSMAAVLLLDLDRFKEVNDMLGHDMGDRVLKEVGERLSGALRGVDTVGRLGGDEFVVVLRDVHDVTDAKRVAAKLQAALEPPFELDGMGLRVRASVGIAVYPTHGDELDVLLRRADAAMYRVKPDGGGAAVFESGSDDRRVSHVAFATQLRRAIEVDQLVLEYQPKIDLRDGAVLGVEALVRWRHPTRGLVQPDEFIRLAEGTGLIKPLTWWVLRTAVADRDAWERGGRSLTMAVNLSASMLRDPELRRTIGEAVAEWGLADGQLELEITESALITDPDAAIDVMAELDDLGIAFALDDFGTGYSSLSHLQRVPARTLKIDKSFVHDVTTRQRDASIVQAVVDLGHHLGIAVVAEGVEDEDMLRRVEELRCDQAQGYHLGRPMAAASLVTWLEATAGTAS